MTKSKKCKNCGKPIAQRMTYCRECFYINNPRFGVKLATHRCEMCGAEIGNRYKYCVTCAKNLKLIKEDN